MFNFINIKERKPEKSRLSFTMETDHIAKLKNIAEEKDLSMHALICSILFSYIDYYDKIEKLM